MRLIDADALIPSYAVAYSTTNNYWHMYVNIETINSAPTIDPVVHGEWIPCSERLPNENGRYLVTNSAWGAMVIDWNAWVDGMWLYPNTKPVAWMPLPEPYKEGNDE